MHVPLPAFFPRVHRVLNRENDENKKFYGACPARPEQVHGSKIPWRRCTAKLFIFFPPPLFHFNCTRGLRVPKARAFHAPQLIQRRAEKTRAWPLYSSPENDKLDLTPLNKREVWFRSGFHLPKGGRKGGKDWKEERRRGGEPWRNLVILYFANASHVLRQINGPLHKVLYQKINRQIIRYEHILPLSNV